MFVLRGRPYAHPVDYGIQKSNVTINKWHKILDSKSGNGKQIMFVFHVVFL